MASARDPELGPLSDTTPEGSDDLIDAVARIEMERQERAREVGNAAACTAALRELRALHASTKEALRLGGPSEEHSTNLAALAAEIGRVERLGGGANRLSAPDGQKREARTRSRPGTPRAPVRNNGRQNGRRNGGRQA